MFWISVWKPWLCNDRVQVITSHFANCKVNSNYCNCKVLNYMKNVKQFFLHGKFNSSGSYSSTLCPYFIHPLHAIISTNIAYTQNYIAKCKKCIAILKKNFRLRRGESFATLGIFIRTLYFQSHFYIIKSLNLFSYLD